MTSVIKVTEDLSWNVSNWIFQTLFEQICGDLQDRADEWGLAEELGDESAAAIAGFLHIGSWPRAKQEFLLQLIQENRSHWPDAELFHQALDELVDKLQRFLHPGD